MSNEEVKNCPLCNSKPVIEIIDSKSHALKNFIPNLKAVCVISCENCGCMVTGNTITEAIDKWNTRRTIEEIIEKVEYLKENTEAEKKATYMNSSNLSDLHFYNGKEEAFHEVINKVEKYL